MFLPRGPTWWELGRSHHLEDLLDGVLVIRSALRTCSVGTWSSASPCRLARRGLGRPPRHVDLLGEDLDICVASKTCSIGTWLSISLHRLARQGLGRPLDFADLLDGDLVVCIASQNCWARTWSSASSRRLCSEGTWSSASLHRLSWWGLGRPLCFSNLLGRDLVVCSVSWTCSTNRQERGYRPYLGYPVPRYLIHCNTDDDTLNVSDDDFPLYLGDFVCKLT